MTQDLSKKILETPFFYDAKKNMGKLNKIVREMGSAFGIKQYQSAINLILAFDSVISTLTSFIFSKGLNKEFDEYLDKRDAAIKLCFSMSHRFKEQVEKSLVPRFGGS